MMPSYDTWLRWGEMARAVARGGHWLIDAASGIEARRAETVQHGSVHESPTGNPVPDAGDIRIVTTFYPPDRRGDRTNYPNRMKAYFDGIADALGVNDRRFLPVYHFAEPTKPGRVVIVIETAQ